jgi:hypothetical protein
MSPAVENTLSLGIMAQHIAKHHVDINIEKTLIVFSHVEQPTKIILGRRNEEVSVYSRKESTSLELNPNVSLESIELTHS